MTEGKNGYIIFVRKSFQMQRSDEKSKRSDLSIQPAAKGNLA